LYPEDDLQLQVQGCVDLFNDHSQVFPVLRHNVVMLAARNLTLKLSNKQGQGFASS
jgi:hypothetical protein